MTHAGWFQPAGGHCDGLGQLTSASASCHCSVCSRVCRQSVCTAPPCSLHSSLTISAYRQAELTSSATLAARGVERGWGMAPSAGGGSPPSSALLVRLSSSTSGSPACMRNRRVFGNQQ